MTLMKLEVSQSLPSSVLAGRLTVLKRIRRPIQGQPGYSAAPYLACAVPARAVYWRQPGIAPVGNPLVVPELLCHLFSANLSAHARFNMLRSRPGRRNSGVKPERSLSPQIEEILYKQSSTNGADVRALGKGQKFSLRNRSCGFHDRLWAGAASQSSVIRDRANSCFAARHA